MNETTQNTFDEYALRKEAERLGITFVGIQNGYKYLPSYALFQDNLTGSFTLQKGEDVAQALARKREEFKIGAVKILEE